MGSRWHQQPLLHFLLIGGVFFGLHAVMRPLAPSVPEAAGPGVPDLEIRVSAEDQARLGRQFQSLQGRPPSEAELRGLVNSHAREEMLYREALQLGLDRDDTIVRRRMVQKMEFLALELAGEAEPTELALQAWLDRDPERYRQPESLSFTHIYFSKDRHRGQAQQQAEQVLALLAGRPDAPRRAPELGDPFLAGYDFKAQSPAEVERSFGKGFAQQVFRLEAGAWRGPLESSYGQHLVWVQDRLGSRLPTLAEVRLEVRRDSMAAFRTQTKEQLDERLRGRYNVVVDAPGPRQGLGQAASPTEARGP